MDLFLRAMLLHVMVSQTPVLHFYLCISGSLSFSLVAAVARLKPDNPLYGSSQIEYVRYLFFCLSTYSLIPWKLKWKY